MSYEKLTIQQIVAKYCKNGKHCVGIDPTCGIDFSMGDHSAKCCHCKLAVILEVDSENS